MRLAVNGILTSLLLAAALVAPCVVAGTVTVSVALDTDSNPGTGCMYATVDGPVPGIEQVATTVVTTTAGGASVTRLERQPCIGGSFAAPVVFDTGGWSVGIGNGVGGSAVVESSIPLSMLPPAALMRAVVTANDGAGGQDATSPFTIALAPAAALGPAAPIPLSPWLLPPLALLLFGLTAWLHRRYSGESRLIVLVSVLAASGLAWAATVLRDGNIADWAGIGPAMSDPKGDAPINADLVAVFYQQDGANLYLRFDADIRKDVAAGNQAPTVSAGANQTIALAASASLVGTVTDDGLPNPPGALTQTWTKFSGPGTVAFGNAALAATTATFSAPGTYVLKLSAFDGALTGSANVTITVNAGGGVANQPPSVNAGAAQTITLPAVATLAGTATDDGLPAPPGALTTTWSLVSGPGAGVLFGNANAPGTTANFLGAGTYVLRLTADDGALTASSTVQINVNDGAPLFARIADRTILLGSRFQLLLQASEGNINDTLTYSLPAAPSGATLNPSPLIDWTPTPAQLGSNTFTAKVVDTAGHAATTTFRVTVVHTNQPPQLAPQANVILPVGSAFSRTLQASDPDAGDTLTLALVSGPAGMTLTGAALNWPTTGKPPGDYAVKVKVTDAGGMFDVKQFTITLQQAAPGPIAKDDGYTVKIAHTLTVPASGVLANDIYSGTNALTAAKRTDPDAGSLTQFNADGSFTFEAPATPPGVPLTMARVWSAGAAGGSDRYHELAADLNGDGNPDIISFDNNAGIRARSGQNGSQLWSADRTGALDCAVNSGQGSMDSRVLADLDDSGHPALAFTTYCAREGSNWYDNIVAFDYLGHVKWVSPPLSKPIPEIVRGATLPPPGGFTPGGLATGSGLSVARLTAGGPPVLLMRQEIPHNWGYSTYVDAANAFHYAGCRAVTGLVADENVACRATFIISGVDGSVLQTLVARNPASLSRTSGPNSLSLLPPIAMDVDGDGRVDLVSGTEVWMQNAAGGFDLAWQLTTSVNDTAVADLDGDGKAEIIHLRSSNEYIEDNRGIFIYSHDGQLKHRIPFQGFWLTPLTIADVDGDGRSDIVLGADGIVYAFRDDGRPLWAYVVPPDIPDNPVFAPFYTQPVQSSALGNAAPQVYDLDGDGVAEVVVSAYSRIIILDGRTGLRKVSPYWTYNFSYHDISALMLLDMNNDGHVDIVQNASFIFNCGFVGANFLQECINLVGPTALSGGGANNWLPGPKAFPHVQYRSTAIDNNSRVLHDTTVSRIFRTPVQQGAIRDPRLAQATSFTYSASDGAATSAPASVFIDIVPDNRPPVFTSVPPTSLLQTSTAKFYDVTAIDPDAGDTITFSLKAAPFWVTMSGPARVSFAPNTPWGQTTVIVTATDSLGASTDQIFIVNLTTTPATVPNVTGMQFEAANTTLIANNLQGVRWAESFSAQPVGTVLAQDPVAGTIVGRLADIQLTVSKGPQPVPVPFVVGKTLTQANSQLLALGFTVVPTAVFSTTYAANQVMAQSPIAGTEVLPTPANPVALTVSAGPPLAGTVAQVVIDPGVASRLAGETIAYKATAVFGDGTSADVTLTALWTSSATSVATVSAVGSVHAVTAGPTMIAAKVAGVTGQAALNVVAIAGSDAIAPVASITSPADGATVTAPTAVTGTATDANFLRYELALAAAGSDTWTLISEGTSPVAGGALGTLDPTLLENGIYTLRLTVFDRGSNTTMAEVAVLVDGNQKVGYFTLSYTDLVVPLSGIPIQIVRTYDSRDKRQGDFGVGWSLGLKAVRVSTTRALGADWQVVKQGLNYTLIPGSVHFVTVTLPTGRVETFDVKITPTVSPLVPFVTARASFTPRPGALGTLQALENVDLLIADPQPGPITLLNDVTLNTFHPDRFLYTQRDGTQFVVTRTHGVESVKDANGNQITISASGISHSSGTSIVFTRDADERITGITDPKGNTRTYAYSGAGDLAAATDRLSNTTRYFYNRFHGLLRIEDPLGQAATRADYDEQGRLIAITDANGQTTRYQHDLSGRQELIEDPLGRITVYTYDVRGNILSVADPLGNTSTFTYDARDNVLTRTNPLGATMSYSYDADDNVTSVIDPLGRTTSSTFDAGGRPLKVTDPRGNFTTARYDSAGGLIGTTDALGNIRSYGNDAAGNPTSATSALGATARNAYDAIGRRTQLTDALGAALSFQYDVNGNLLSQQGATGPAASVSYDAENRVTGTTRGGLQRSLTYDAAGRISAASTSTNRQMSLTNDPVGRLTSIADPVDGPVLQLVYDAVGNLQGFGNGSGNQLTNVYDAANRLIETRGPEGSIERRSYDKAGRVVQVVDVRGDTTRYGYDAAGQLVSLTDALGGQTTYQYDASSNRIAQTDPAGRTTSFGYDATNRLVRTTYADGRVETRDYDADGRLVLLTDPAGQSTAYAYDDQGRLLSITDALGRITRHAYQGSAQRSDTTDANGNTTRFAYDTAGRLAKTTFPLGGMDTLSYDIVGNPLSKTNGQGETTQYQYDARGRRSATVLPGGATETYTYTADHLPHTITDARGTTTLDYDPLTRRLVRVTEPDGRYVRYAYDAAGNKNVVAHSNGGSELVTQYAYDALNRLVRITDSGGGVSTQVWDSTGNLVRVSRPNGVTTQTTYDLRDRPVAISHRNSVGALIAQETYTLDALGNRVRIDRQDGSRVEYRYDALSRVTRELRFDAGGNPAAEAVFAYDAVGNLVSAGPPAAPAVYVYNADNQLVSGGGVTFAYDGAGRRVQESWTPQAGSPKSMQYTWDARDRLSSFRDAGGAATTYAYDAEGIRVSKAGAAGATAFLVDRSNATGFSQLVGRITPAGSDTFVWASQMLRAIEAGTPRYPLFDALGSTRLLTGTSGAVTDTFDFTAYGEPATVSGASSLPHRFAGEETDAESGLSYLRARYYDPRTGRFLSRDAKPGYPGEPMSLNPYLYVAGNPVNRTDPSGNDFSIASTLFASAQSLVVRGQEILKTRRALLNAKKATLTTTRLLAGAMAVEAVVEDLGNHTQVNKWFGGGTIEAVSQALAVPEFGSAVNIGIHLVAEGVMALTAYKLLDGEEITINVEGVGILTSGSAVEAKEQWSLDSGVGNKCRSTVMNALAWAARDAKPQVVELCSLYFFQPYLPTIQVLTTAGKASMPGIFLHEFTHLAAHTQDNAYECVPTAVLALAKSSTPAALANADSYRCWAEAAALGWIGLAGK
ncbi:MAG: RHS repeat-associated core domain-containing protein [Betaproteobacteria bacterium]